MSTLVWALLVASYIVLLWIFGAFSRPPVAEAR